MSDRVITIAPARIRPFATQPREYFDEADMRDLKRSIKAVGQQVEIIVRPLMSGGSRQTYELVDGQRRWHACKELGIDIRACVREGMGDAEDQFLTSVVANFARSENTPAEIAKAIARLRRRPDIAALQPFEQAQALGDIFGRTPSWVYGYDKLQKLDPAVLALTAPPTPQEKRISRQAAILLADLKPAEQRKFARLAALRSARGLELAIRASAKTSGVKLRANMPNRHRKRSEVSLRVIAESAASLLDMATDFKTVFASRPRDEQESFVYRIDHVIEELLKVRALAARVVGIRERRRAA